MSDHRSRDPDTVREALQQGKERVRRSRALLGWIEELLRRDRDDEDDDPDSSPAPA
jgi:hypothetical protein